MSSLYLGVGRRGRQIIINKFKGVFVMKQREYSFESSTNLGDIHADMWLPEGEIKAIVQISHGMAEYGLRYKDFAEYLCGNSVAVVVADHMGHGKSFDGKEENYGYFGSENGHAHLADDQAKLTDIVKNDYPGVPYILFGHSMGSFIARRYTAFYGDKIDAVVYCGTAGSNPAASIGRAVANMTAKLKGQKFKSKFIDKLAFGTYNKRTENNTPFDWLSTDRKQVEKYIDDDLCGGLFSATGYRDLMDLLIFVNSSECYDKIPKGLKIFVIAGEEDPVGTYGKGVKEVFDKLVSTGHSDCRLKLYPGMRHEILNEVGNEQVYEDVLNFVLSVVK